MDSEIVSFSLHLCLPSRLHKKCSRCNRTICLDLGPRKNKTKARVASFPNASSNFRDSIVLPVVRIR